MRRMPAAFAASWESALQGRARQVRDAADQTTRGSGAGPSPTHAEHVGAPPEGRAIAHDCAGVLLSFAHSSGRVLWRKLRCRTRAGGGGRPKACSVFRPPFLTTVIFFNKKNRT